MIKTENKISVIIPCYNDGKYLPEAVLSVEKCDEGLYEIIIIDDGSYDRKTNETINSMEKKGHRVYRIKHQGQSAARNFGVKKARCPHILFLDADNKIVPGYIEKSIKLLQKNPEIGIVYGDRKEFGLREGVVAQKDFDISEIIFTNYIDTCAIIRKKVWRDCKGFDKKMFILEDWEFWINAYKHGWKFKRIPEAMFYYRIRNNSVTAKVRTRSNRIKILKHVYKKHYPLFIGCLDGKIAQIIQINEQINQKDIQISQMNEQINQLNRAIFEKENNIYFLKQELWNIKKSLSWRFSQGLEKAIFYFLPENSVFGRFYRLLIRSAHGFGQADKKTKKTSNELNQKIERAKKLIKSSRFKPLIFKKTSHPEISIIMPAFNNWAYTYNCLCSVLKNTKSVEYEIIVADDNSNDKTKNIKKYVKNIKVARNDKNLGFLENCNNAAGFALGKYLLFLNNDTYVSENSILYLIDTIKKNSRVGAVGGKVIFPDGILQEAGSIIWKDASTLGYGRGDSPLKPEYNFIREVDYCSGAFLLVRKDLFLKLGKFDTAYSPGYYEDVDFCMKLKKSGYKTIYQPLAEIVHYGSVSFGRTQGVSLHLKNAPIFLSKWRHDLAGHYSFGEDLIARFSCSKKRILYIDDQIPDTKLGSGYPRTCAILDNLLELGFQVTFYPAAMARDNPSSRINLQQRGVEVMHDIKDYKLDFEEFFKERKDYYDTIFISRPHNMAAAIDVIKKYNSGIKIIYDAEAIFSLREISYYESIGKIIYENAAEKKIKDEVKICDKADLIVTVSEKEKKIFEGHGVKNLFVVPHGSKINSTPKKFQEREGLLFVGPVLFNGPKNPNLDAIVYFSKKIFPLIKKKLNCNFYIIGTDKSGVVKSLKGDGIKIEGSVDNLYNYYNNCRVFVVPTRFSAGIPLKAIEAASFGIPMVVSSITASQLEWKNYVDCLVADNPIDFAKKVEELYINPNLWNKIRDNSIKRIKKEYTPELIKRKLAEIFSLL